MDLFEILKNNIGSELTRARHERNLRLQTVAETCGMTVSELDDLETAIQILCYSQYETLLRFYKKHAEIVLEDKDDEQKI